MMEVEKGNEEFDAVFKKFDEIQFSRRTLEELTLHTIPSGSQEFQKVLCTCDDSEKKQNNDNDEGTFRQRSHTIDSSTYVKHKKHHVHFSSNLETKPIKLGSSESIDGTRHGILIRHNENSSGRERSNTIDTVYKKDKKFITIPQGSGIHYSSSDSIEEEQTTDHKKSQSVQCSKRKTSVGDKKNSRNTGGKSSFSQRKTSVGESPLSRTNTSSPQRKHAQSNHRVH